MKAAISVREPIKIKLNESNNDSEEVRKFLSFDGVALALNEAVLAK